MKRNALLLFCMIFGLSGYGQNNPTSYTNKYKLNLDATITEDTISYPFITNVASTQMFCIKPIQGKDGNYGEEFTPNPMYSSLRKVIRRRILLPDLSVKKEGNVSLGMKGNGLKLVSMKIQGLDFQEKILFGDTLTFVPDTMYSQLQGNYPLENIEMLDIAIDIEGENNQKASFFFSGLEIKVDGKLINDMPFCEIPEVEIDRQQLVPIKDDTSIEFGKIKAFQGKKIIGLGESLHHHLDLNHFAFRMMEEAVRTINSKVLVVEMPIEKSLFYNRYISDASFMLPEDLFNDAAYKDYLTLLDNLRRHNLTCSPNERVILLGMDYNTSLNKDSNSLVDLFDFLCSLNKDKHTKEVDCFSLMLYDNKPNEALKYLKLHRKGLEKVITADELKCMEHILSFTTNLSDNPVTRMNVRDSIMAENLAFIERNFASGKDEKIMVRGHSLHLNRISAYPIDSYRSAGNYLQEKYGNLYAPFLLVTDGGYHYSNNTLIGILLYNKLLHPCNGSIESALAHTSETSCYLPITEKHDCIVWSRLVANPDQGGFNFYPSNLFQRYDGVFYVKAGKSLETPSKKSNDEVIKDLGEKLDRMKRISNDRKALANEIRKRCEAVDNR